MDGSALDRRRPAWPWGLLALLLLALLCLRLALAGLTVQTAFPWSATILLDGAARIADGQVPYRDFHTPVGFTYLGLLAVCLRLAHGLPHALATFSACAGLLTGALAWWVGVRRCAPPLAAAVALGIGMLAASPAFLAYGPLDLSYGGHYSRLSWSLFFVVALYAAGPACAAGRRAELLEAAAIGACLGLLAGTKFTYLLAGLAVVGLAWWQRSPGWRTPLSMLAGVVAAVAVGLEVSGASLGGYLRDCGLVGSSASLLSLLLVSRHNLDVLGLGLIAVAALLTWPAHRQGWRLSAARPLPDAFLMALAVLGLGLGLSATNGNEQVSPVYALVLIILAVPAAAPVAGMATAAGARHAPLLIAAAVSTALAVRLAMPIAIGPYAANVAPLGTLAAGPWKGLAFLPGGDLAPQRDQLWTYLSREPRGMLCNAWYDWLRDGETILRSRVGAGERVLCMDFLNPFPYALQRPAPLGDHLYWHFGRNVGRASAPRPETLFASVDWVMIPKVPIFREVTHDKCDLYGDWIKAHYRELILTRVGDHYEEVQTQDARLIGSEWWTCYQRRPAVH